jgi:tetratricopeptide (TPR) repeat protein
MLGQAYSEAGEATVMHPLLQRAHDLLEKVGDYRGKAWVSIMHHYRAAIERDLENAIRHANRSVQMGKESGGFQHEVSAALARAAECLLRLGRYREAFDYCQQSLVISLKASNKLEYGYAYMVLAEIHASEDYRDWEKAAWYLDESLKTFQDVGAQVDVGRVYLAGARISLLRKDGNARQLAHAAREIFAERGAKALLKEAEQLMNTLTP